MRKTLRKLSLSNRYFMITLGIFLMVAGFYYFIMPAALVIGGVSGVGVLFSELFAIRVSLVVLVLNVVLLGFGWLFLGFKSFVRSIYGSLMFPLILFLLEEFSPPLDMEPDFLLYTTFGGFLLGIGFGYVIKYGGTSGGTDIPIKILHKRLKLPLSFSIYLVDGAIILSGVIALYAERGVTAGLYALLTMVISGRVADFVIIGSNTLKAVHIVTEKPDRIKQLIYEALERGVSLIPMKGGYSMRQKTIVLSVITRDEYHRIRDIIAAVDEEAFVFASPATEIQGDFTTHWEDD